MIADADLPDLTHAGQDGAIARVQGCTDVEALKRWHAAESRGEVRRVIEHVLAGLGVRSWSAAARPA